MKKSILVTVALLLATAAFADDQVKPASPCEALAVAKSRPVAVESAGGAQMDLVSISYIGANKEFNLEFSNDEESVVVSSTISAGNREGKCKLTKPYQLNND